MKTIEKCHDIQRGHFSLVFVALILTFRIKGVSAWLKPKMVTQVSRYSPEV